MQNNNAKRTGYGKKVSNRFRLSSGKYILYGLSEGRSLK